MENEGHIRIYRKIIDWEWYSDNPTRSLFLHLIFKANWKEKNWKGITIERGQILTGRKILALELNLSEMQIRTALNNLKSTSEITIKVTNKYSLITVNNYFKFQYNNQQDNQQDNQQITNKQPTDNQQTTTTNKENNDKNDKNDKKGESKNPPTPAQTMKDFLQMVSEKTERYSNFTKQTSLSAHLSEDTVRAELDKFICYWTEKTKDGLRERWELEMFFVVVKRLGTWFSRINNFKQNNLQINQTKPRGRIIS
jgi:ABC-type antimicrobial peptide transport system permease subunit